MPNISRWLTELGLEKYVSAFADAEIDFETLPDLAEDNLKELGLPLGPRRKVWGAIQRLGAADTPSAETPTSVALPESQPEPLAPTSSSDAERRHLTVMFIDLVGSTEMASRIDAEDMRNVITNYQNTVAGVVSRYEGFVAKFMGDGVLCYFGWPRANEDDVERAVRAGLSIIDTIKMMTAPDGSSLATRIGIATGVVIVGDLIGSGATQEAAVVGETPNLAARLQGVAEPNQIVLPKETQRLLGNTYKLRSIGDQALKGISGSVEAFVVEGEATVESRFAARQSGTLTPIVGRDREIELMLERWALARSGQGQLLIVSGEAGIGKSRITRAVIDEIGRDDHIHMTYQCSPYHADSAFYPIIQQMSFAAGISQADTPVVRLDKIETLLGADNDALKFAAPMLGLDGEVRYGKLDLTPAQQRARTMQALTGLLVEQAKNKPLLLVYEDLHWIDPTSLELLDLLLDAIADQPIMILATARPTFEYGFGGHPIVTRFALNRLGKDQIGAIVSKLTDGKALPDEIMEIIASRTDGVPLFVEELTKTILESGGLKEDGDHLVLDGPLSTIAIPTTLHDSLMARLDRLQPIKEVAQTAACIGREFSHELLTQVSTLPQAELTAALDGLIEAELIYRRGLPPEATYLFKHALVRDAAYESLLKKNRKKVHIGIVEALEEIASEGAEIEPALLAYHCTEADLKPQAIAYWGKAGQEAIQRSANVEAIAHLTYGVELIQTLSESSERDEQELKFQTMLAGPLIATKGYGASETGAVFARALELSRTVDNSNFLFPVLYQQWVYNLIGSGIDEAHQRAMDFKEIADRQTDTMPQVVAHRVTGVSLYYKGDFSHSKAEFDHALSLYDEEQHKEATFRFGQDPKSACLAFLSSLLHVMGHIDQSRDVSVLALDRAKQLKHTNTLAYTLFFSAVRNAFCRRDLTELEKATDSLSSLANEQGLEMWTAYALINCGWIASQKGNPKEGIKLCEAGLAKMQETGTDLDRPLGLAQLAECHATFGQNEKALAVVESALDNIEQTNDRWYEAELLRLKADQIVALKADGWFKSAKQIYDASLATARAQQAKFWELRTATSLAHLLLANEDSCGAREMLEPVLEGFTAATGSADVEAAKSFLAKLSI